jgi:hypothetical protein
LIKFMFVWFTSSTAQGGGGSFTNRKPIGKVGCCESRMAEQSPDGPKGGWICVFWSIAMVAVVTSPHLLDVVWCSAGVVVVVA